jgi:replication factor A1
LQIIKKDAFYTVFISDSVDYSQCICSISAHNEIDNLQEYSIIKLLEYNVTEVKHFKCIIITKIDIRSFDCNKIGEPEKLEIQAPSKSLRNSSEGAKDPNPPASPMIKLIKSENDLESSKISASEGRNPQNSQSRMSFPMTENNFIPGGQSSSFSNLMVAQQAEENNFYTPICVLSMTCFDWTIKARVLEKSDVRYWDKPTSKGKLFNVVLVDERGDQIKGTFFNNAVEMFYDVIEIMKVYTFSGGNVKNMNRAYSSLDVQFEISFDKNSVIKPMEDDDKIPSFKFNFQNIDYLPKLNINSSVDVCAILEEIGNIEEFTSKRGELLVKRNLMITDHTCHSIEVTLWNDLAKLTEFNGLDVKDCNIIVFKSIKIKDFNKISLSSDRTCTKVFINPKDNKQADFLRKWKAEKKSALLATPLTERRDKSRDAKLKTISEIKEEWNNVLIHSNNKTDTLKIIGILGKLMLTDEKPLWYKSCPNEKCKKKVTLDHQGFYTCETCRQTFEICKYRYLCNLTISDCTGMLYATAFDESMSALLKISAHQLYDVFMQSQTDAEDILAKIASIPVVAVLNVKEADTNTGYKFTVKRFDDYDAQSLSQLLSQEIKSFLEY